MKKTVKKRISPQQEGLLLKIVLALMLAAVLWIIFSPGSGLVTLHGHRSDLGQLERKNAELEQENRNLQIEIDRLQNDPEYLEEVARKEYGLLRKNEKVFDFSGNNPELK